MLDPKKNRTLLDKKAQLRINVLLKNQSWPPQQREDVVQVKGLVGGFDLTRFPSVQKEHFAPQKEAPAIL